MRKTLLGLGFLALPNMAMAVDAADTTKKPPTALEIIKKVETRKMPTSARSKVTLTIDRGGSKVEKVFQFTSLKINDNETYSLIEFEKPGNTKILAHARRKGDDERWIKTSSGQPKKIASGGDDQSFAQSHFTYEDLQFAKENDFDSELVCETAGKCEMIYMDAPHYKIKLKPKSQDKQYAYLIGFVRVSDFLPTKTEYYTKDSKLIKEVVMDQIKNIPETEKNPDKVYATPTRITLKMADGSGSSTLEFSSGEVDSPAIKKQQFDKNLM